MTTDVSNAGLPDVVLRQLHENISNMFQSTDINDVTTITDSINKLMKETLNPASYYEPVTLTPDQASQYGLTVPDGWTVYAQNDKSGGVSFSMTDPNGWKIDDTGTYTAPDGTQFTQDELKQSADAADVIDRNKDMILGGIRHILPGAFGTSNDVSSQDIISLAGADPQFSQIFTSSLINLGNSGYKSKNQAQIDDAFTVLKYLGFKDTDLQSMFPDYLKQVKQQALSKEGIGGKVQDWLWRNTVGAKWLGAAFKEIGAPWEQSIGLITSAIRGNTQDEQYINTMSQLFKKYGPLVYFTSAAQQAYAGWQAPGGKWSKIAISVADPLWWISGTKVFQGVAQFTESSEILSSIPALTKITQTAARLVQFVENAPIKAVVAPFKWFTGRGVNAAGEAFSTAEAAAGEAFSNDILKMAARPAIQDWAEKAIPDVKGVSLELPKYDDFAKAAFAETPAREIAMKAIKAPVFGNLIEKLYRTSIDSNLIAGNAEAESLLSGEIGKIALYNMTLRSMGRSEAAILEKTLQAIEMDPIKMFGLDENGISQTIRTLAGHEGESLAIQRIFENPTVYALTKAQLSYIAVFHSVEDDIAAMMSREGIKFGKLAVPEGEHYIHRVVTEEGVGAGIKGKIGRTPSFFKHRTIGQVTEEIAQAIPYERKPEVWMKDYVTQAITKIADQRMVDLVKNLPGVRVSLENPVFKEFTSALTNVERGGIPNPEALSSITKAFPGLGKRFLAIIKKPTAEDEALRGYLKDSWNQVKTLQQRLSDTEAALKQAKTTPEAPLGGITEVKPLEVTPPSIETFTKQMEALPYDDRMAFYDVFENRIAAIDQASGEMSQEAQGIKDYIASDPVAAFRGNIGLRKTSLLSLLDKYGKFPDTITQKQADILLMGRELKPNALDAAGRVRWIYVMDELASHFNMTEQELVDHLENLASMRGRMADLQNLVKEALDRKTELETMREAVRNVNIHSVNLPLEGDGRPVWATSEPVPTEESLNRPPLSSGEYKPISSVLDEVPARTSLADRNAEIKSIRDDLNKMAHPTAKLGESGVGHPAFRGWVLPPEIARTINYMWETRSNAFLKTTSKVAGLLRMPIAFNLAELIVHGMPAMGRLLATGDFKYMFKWWEAWPRAIWTVLDPQYYAKWSVEHLAEIQQRIAFGGSESAVEWFERMPLLMKVAEHVPGGETLLRQTLGRFNTSWGFGIDYLRQSTWEALAPKALATGNGFELAKFCDNLVGMTNPEAAGVPRWMSDIKSSFIWMGPKYTEASIHLISDIFHGWYTARQALIALTTMMGAGSLTYYLTCKGLGEEPNFNPASGRFLSIKIDGNYYSLSGVWYGMARLSADLYNIAANFPERYTDLIRISKEGALNRDNPFLYWWYTRASPLSGTLIDTLWQHKDIFGGHDLNSPLSYAKYFADKLMPMGISSEVDPFLWGGQKAGVTAFLSEEIGLKTYPETLYDILYTKAATYIAQMQPSEILADQMTKWQAGKLTWNDLTKEQQATLKLRYPELNDMQNAARGASASYATPLRAAWLTALATDKDYKIRTGNALTTDLMNGVDSTGAVFNTKSFRERVKDMNTAYGIMYDMTANDPRFASIYAGMNKSNPKDAETVDMAYYNYLDTVVGGQFESDDGIFNAKAYDAAIAAFKDKWGIDIYNQVMTILEANKMGENPLVVQLWKDKNTLAESGYWDMPTDTTEQKQARDDFLTRNPNIDALLFFWGYTSGLHSVEAYNDVVAFCKNTGVPYTAVGGTSKFPPGSIAVDYVAYINGNLTGWDRENYLRDHRDLYTWGVATLGWSTIDFNKVPPPSTKKLLDEYDSALTGAGTKNIKLLLRCQSQELDNWLVTWENFTPVFGGDKCSIFGLGPEKTQEPPVLIYPNQ